MNISTSNGFGRMVISKDLNINFNKIKGEQPPVNTALNAADNPQNMMQNNFVHSELEQSRDIQATQKSLQVQKKHE